MTHPPATMTTEAHPKIHGAWDILCYQSLPSFGTAPLLAFFACNF